MCTPLAAVTDLFKPGFLPPRPECVLPERPAACERTHGLSASLLRSLLQERWGVAVLAVPVPQDSAPQAREDDSHLSHSKEQS